MQQTVRQYLESRYERVDNYTVRLLSGHARSYCVGRKIQFGRVYVGRGVPYRNTYDVEVLDLICKNYVGLRRKL